MSAFPPIHTQKGISVPPSTALLFLASYLESAKTSPHLLPNARLDPSGPTAGSMSSSVTIHNLQRVEAGLRGEWLAPKLDLEEQDQIAKETSRRGGAGEKTEEEVAAEEGWEDLEQYQREQSVEGPEQAQEDLGVEDDGDVEERIDIEEDHDGDVVIKTPVSASKTKSTKPVKDITGGVKDSKVKKLDPAARKKEKKERHKAEKKAKEEARKQQAQS